MSKKNQYKKKQKNVSEYRADLGSVELAKKNAEEFAKVLKQLDVNTAANKPMPIDNAFTKKKYRDMLKDMQKNMYKLMSMSNFLMRVSTPYRRMISYFAGIPLFCYTLIPQLELINDDLDKDKLLKQYNKMAKRVQKMNLSYELRKVLQGVLLDGVYFGFIYEDNNSFFIHRLEPEYCKVVGMSAGCYDFAFDLTFFDKYPDRLTGMDDVFTEMYNLYQVDKKLYRYQRIDPARSICILANPDRPDVIYPPFLGLFEPILDLIDARAIQKNKDTIDNYKLITLKIPTVQNSKSVDDFLIHATTAEAFYNRLLDIVPPAVGVALSPMDIDTVDFNNNKDDRSDVHGSSMRMVFSESGVAEGLFSAKEMNKESMRSTIETDVAFVWSIMESIEAWMRRYIYFYSSGRFKYTFKFERVTIFNQKEVLTQELALANSGVPNKLKLAAVAGFTPSEVVSSQIFENDVLHLTDNWKPLQTSYTMSGKIQQEQIEDDEDVPDNTDEPVEEPTEVEEPDATDEE